MKKELILKVLNVTGSVLVGSVTIAVIIENQKLRNRLEKAALISTLQTNLTDTTIKLFKHEADTNIKLREEIKFLKLNQKKVKSN